MAAVLPVDLARGEIVLIPQFRLSAHLANGHGELLEIVAGRVEAGESAADAARRECTEEIRVAPSALAELFSYLTSPGITDEEVTVFVAAVDATQVPPRVVDPAEGEHIETLRVSMNTAMAALAQGTMGAARSHGACSGWRSTAAAPPRCWARAGGLAEFRHVFLIRAVKPHSGMKHPRPACP